MCYNAYCTVMVLCIFISHSLSIRCNWHISCLLLAADGLTVSPVGSYAEIEGKTQQGTTNRTVAATNMNATSSRAHTIVGITLTQKFKNSAGQDTTKSAVVNLVDLAGRYVKDSAKSKGSNCLLEK